MVRPVDPAIAVRNAALVASYLADPSQSYADLAERFGVGILTVYPILRDAKAINKAQRKQRGKPVKAIDNRLAILGRDLEMKVISEYGTGRGTSEASKAARGIGLKSAQHLTYTFRGQANLSYVELEKVARFLAYGSIAEMLASVDRKLSQGLGK